MLHLQLYFNEENILEHSHYTRRAWQEMREGN